MSNLDKIENFCRDRQICDIFELLRHFDEHEKELAAWIRSGDKTRIREVEARIDQVRFDIAYAHV